MKVHAVLLAAGSSERFKSKQSKILFNFEGKPLIFYPLQTFLNSGLFETITLLVNDYNKEDLLELISSNKSLSSIKVIDGGKTRHDSEQIALQYLEEEGVNSDDLVSIHDAARSFINKELLSKLIDCAKQYNSSVPAIKSRTIVSRESKLLAPNQYMYYSMQTPQTFLAKDLFFSYSKANEEGWFGIDTVECISNYTDIKAKIVEGTDLNMKITFIEDLEKIKKIIKDNDFKI